MPEKSIHDQPEYTKIDPPGKAIRITDNVTKQYYQLPIPANQGWLEYLLDEQLKVLKDIRSNTGWILAIALLLVVLGGCSLLVSF